MIIDRYITAEIVRPFSISVGLLVVVFTGYSSVVRLAESAEGVIHIYMVAKLILLKSLSALEILLPTALYLSVMSAISRLYRDSEIAAMNAAGIGEKRIMLPVLRIAIIVAVMVGLLSLYGRPWAYRESYRVEAQAASEFDVGTMEAGRFQVLQGERYVLFAGSIDRGHSSLHDVFLQSEQGSRTRVIYAREANLHKTAAGDEYQVEFHDGYGYILDRNGHDDITFRFLDTLTIRIQDNVAGKSYKRKAAPTGRLALSNRPRDIAEYQWRLSTPVATVLLALLAVPLGRNNPRRSRFRSFILAIVVYVIIFNLTSLARNLVEQGSVGPMPGLWWAHAFPAGLLAVLLLKPRLAQWKKPG